MKKTTILFACAAALLLLPNASLADTTQQNDSSSETLDVSFTLPEEQAPYAYRLTDAYVVSRVSFRAKDALTIAPEQAAPLSMETYREQQFDRLADGVRLALDMDAVYAAMGLKNPKGASL